ncbi:MAG: SagB/ThcOx family dehydrogenase [Candidatus Aminicenantes bacterium]|nr:SagB/ThcOx family dehydrogenase [Candidatus Aminicenantes bacterium]
MKKLKGRVVGPLIFFSLFIWPGLFLGQELKPIKLNPPDKKRGLPFMEALAVRASVTEWSEKDLSLQDLSDLLWAANGINRPDSGKRTAASAQNAQDVDIYVFMKEGVYLYEAKDHSLIPLLAGDYRTELFFVRPPAKAPEAKPAPNLAPVVLLLVSDISRFRSGSQELRLEWAAIDTGIVSQNISLFCAATGLGTRPRASMDRPKIKELLKLKESQIPFLNHPVGYKK